ncbi:MAG: hypothetical protein HN764_07835, partial [Gammaproteobacteria bacterium]|nr:hypothetical protein [Gammaproteobacteria bacterium]
VYASYVSHVANGGIKQAWAEIIKLVALADVEAVKHQFTIIQDLTDRRGRIMGGHSHLGACGILALILSILQPYSSLGEKLKKVFAFSILLGALLQFAGILSSYFLSTEYIYLSDLGGLLLATGVAGTFIGLIRGGASGTSIDFSSIAEERLNSSSSVLLLKAGMLLMVICISLGIYLAWLMYSGDEANSLNAISQSVQLLMQQDVESAQAAITKFKSLQTKMALNAASHSHGLEMGLIMILLAMVRKWINLDEKIFRFWSMAFVACSYLLPTWIFLAINVSLSFAKFANYTGVCLGTLLFIASMSVIRSSASGNSEDLKRGKT